MSLACSRHSGGWEHERRPERLLADGPVPVRGRQQARHPERRPDRPRRLGDHAQAIEPLMRAAHSLKGAARIVGLDPAVRIAHSLEDAFVAAQGGEFVIGAPQVDVMLRGVDLLGQIAQLEEGQSADLGAGQRGDHRRAWSTTSIDSRRPRRATETAARGGQPRHRACLRAHDRPLGPGSPCTSPTPAAVSRVPVAIPAAAPDWSTADPRGVEVAPRRLGLAARRDGSGRPGLGREPLADDGPGWRVAGPGSPAPAVRRALTAAKRQQADLLETLRAIENQPRLGGDLDPRRTCWSGRGPRPTDAARP